VPQWVQNAIKQFEKDSDAGTLVILQGHALQTIQRLSGSPPGTADPVSFVLCQGHIHVHQSQDPLSVIRIRQHPLCGPSGRYLPLLRYRTPPSAHRSQNQLPLQALTLKSLTVFMTSFHVLLTKVARGPTKTVPVLELPINPFHLGASSLIAVASRYHPSPAVAQSRAVLQHLMLSQNITSTWTGSSPHL
jgi:hypothetical protein